jgi:hypothetical protein
MKSSSLNGELCAGSFKALLLIFNLVCARTVMAREAHKLGRPHS